MNRFFVLLLAFVVSQSYGASAVPNIFASQPSGNVPASYLDTNFALTSNYNTFSNYLVDSGVANVYVVTFPTGTTGTLAAGLLVNFKASADNTGASTLAVNGMTAKNITNYDASALTAGQIKAGAIVSVIYDGTQFKLSGQPGGMIGTWAIPGTIGSTTPNTGAFTTLSTSGLLSANLGATIASGQTLTLTGATVAGAPTYTLAQPITLSTAAQPNITSVGTLTILAVTGDITSSGANGFKTLADNTGLYFNGTRNAVVGSNALDTVSIAAANANKLVVSSTGVAVTGVQTITGPNAASTVFSANNTVGTQEIWTGLGSQTFGGGSPNAANAALYVARDGGTGRSLNAGGTINASGLDYAEYIHKADGTTLNRGDVAFLDKNGLLTTLFNPSAVVMVKSTNPSYVGGDVWGTEDIVGKRPALPKDDAPQSEKDAYAIASSAFDQRLETERQKVDRMAFAGIVPVNITGGNNGDLIRVDSGGLVAWDVFADASVPQWFKDYLRTVGRVIRTLPDGRKEIVVTVH